MHLPSMICPTCLADVSGGAIQWRSRHGQPAPPPPKRQRSRLRLSRSRVADRQASEWAHWLGNGYAPFCLNGHELPPGFLQQRNIVVGLLGPPASSKSHYLASLVGLLLQGGLAHHDLAFGLAESSADRFRRDYYRPLWDERRQLQLTQPAADRDGVVEHHPPITLTVHDVRSGERWNLILFDASGEQLLSAEDQARYSPYLLAASAVFMFVDPHTFPSLRSHLGGQENPASIVGVQQVIGSASSIIRRGRGIDDSDDLRDLQAALILSKVDQLSMADLPPSAFEPLDYDALTPSQLMQRIQMDSDYVTAYLEQNGGKNTVLSAMSSFPGLTVHAVSATGCSARTPLAAADTMPRYERISPIRVLDPLLVVLNRAGLLRDEVMTW